MKASTNSHTDNNNSNGGNTMTTTNSTFNIEQAAREIYHELQTDSEVEARTGNNVRTAPSILFAWLEAPGQTDRFDELVYKAVTAAGYTFDESDHAVDEYDNISEKLADRVLELGVEFDHAAIDYVYQPAK